MVLPDAIASVVDPDGRQVVLTHERWSHILEGHSELASHQAQILRAVESPDRRLPGRAKGEEWFYLATVRPSRWLKVVVRYRAGAGRIMTAFARRSLP